MKKLLLFGSMLLFLASKGISQKDTPTVSLHPIRAVLTIADLEDYDRIKKRLPALERKVNVQDSLITLKDLRIDELQKIASNSLQIQSNHVALLAAEKQRADNAVREAKAERRKGFLYKVLAVAAVLFAGYQTLK